MSHLSKYSLMKSASSFLDIVGTGARGLEGDLAVATEVDTVDTLGVVDVEATEAAVEALEAAVEATEAAVEAIEATVDSGFAVETTEVKVVGSSVTPAPVSVPVPVAPVDPVAPVTVDSPVAPVLVVSVAWDRT